MNIFDQIFNEWIDGSSNLSITVEILQTVPNDKEIAHDCYFKIEDGVTFYIRHNKTEAVIAFNIYQVLSSSYLVLKLRHILNKYDLSKVQMPATAVAILNENAFSSMVDAISEHRLEDISGKKLQGVDNIRIIHDYRIANELNPNAVKAYGLWLVRYYNGNKIHYVKTIVVNSLKELMKTDFDLTAGFCYIPFALMDDGLLIDLYEPEITVSEKGLAFALEDQKQNFTNLFYSFVYKDLLSMNIESLKSGIKYDLGVLATKSLFKGIVESSNLLTDNKVKHLFSITLTVDNKDGRVKKIVSDRTSIKGVGPATESKCSHDRSKYVFKVDVDLKDNLVIYSLKAL